MSYIYIYIYDISNLRVNVHGSVHRNNILVYKYQQDAQVTKFIFVWELLYMFRGFNITHLPEHKTAVTTAFGNRYTVIELNFTAKEYR